MKSKKQFLLIGALAAAPLVLSAQANSAATQAVQQGQSAQAAKVQLSPEQKAAIIRGETGAVVEAVESAGFDTGDLDAMGALAAEIFNQVLADTNATDFERLSGPVAATITRGINLFASKNNFSDEQLTEALRASSSAIAETAVETAVQQGADSSIVATNVGTDILEATETDRDAVQTALMFGARKGANNSGQNADYILATLATAISPSFVVTGNNDFDPNREIPDVTEDPTPNGFADNSQP